MLPLFNFSDDNWDNNDAEVVCRMLGLNATFAKATKNSQHGNWRDNFIMDEVKCVGTEETLEDCPHLTSDDCKASEGAGVLCLGKKKSYIASHFSCTVDSKL